MDSLQVFWAIFGLLIGIAYLISRTEFWQVAKLKAIHIDQKGIVLPSALILTLPFVFGKLALLDMQSLAELAKIGTPLLVAIGYANYRWNQKKDSDKAIVEQAKIILKRAYEILTTDGSESVPVPSDRYNWLTASRLILKYESLGKNIETDVYRKIYNAEEDFWRYKFFLLFKDKKVYEAAYFCPSNTHSVTYRPRISPRSALIIFSFIELSQDKDPLHTDGKQEYHIPYLAQKYPGLLSLINKYPNTFELSEDCIREHNR